MQLSWPNSNPSQRFITSLVQAGTAIVASVVLPLLSLSSANANVTYSTLNYPQAEPDGSTFLTGIRANSTDGVYMTGLYLPPNGNSTQGLFYSGSLEGVGDWHLVNFPDYLGGTVTSTAMYGPDNSNGVDSIRAVGSYKTTETGAYDLGLLYDGPLDGSGSWQTLDAKDLNPNALNTIAHSTNGGLVVGNYDINLIAGKAFIYDINQQQWWDFNPIGASSITAYGIWHNGGSSYTIAGGYSNAPSFSGLDQGYLADWDAASQSVIRWRSYNYNNQPITSLVSHFDGITGDGNGGYTLTGDWVGVGASNGLGFFAQVSRNPLGGFGEAQWTQINYPNSTVTSGNSVFENVVIGVYTDDQAGVNGYVATVVVPEPSTIGGALLFSLFLLKRSRSGKPD
jgi:hypothetical protein